MEPKHVDEAIQDDNWVKAMQKDLDQFQKNDVQKLVKLPKGKKAVGAKWVFSKKLNRNGKVVRNKARLVGKLVKIIHDYIVQPKGKKVVGAKWVFSKLHCLKETGKLVIIIHDYYN